MHTRSTRKNSPMRRILPVSRTAVDLNRADLRLSTYIHTVMNSQSPPMELDELPAIHCDAIDSFTVFAPAIFTMAGLVIDGWSMEAEI